VPRHDYRCAGCQHTLREVYRSVHVGAQADPPRCTFCGQPMIWIVPVVANDLRSDSDDARFKKFTVYDGDTPVVIDSLSKLRQVERDTEQKARNGEGQQLVFRGYANNHSNMAVNTFGDGPAEKPSAAGKAKYGLQSGTIKTTEAPDTTFGPGVSESNCSALDMPAPPAPAAPTE
jgi:hypothetical protein